MFKNFYNLAREMLHLLANNPRFFVKRIFLQIRSFFVPMPSTSFLGKINGILFDFDFEMSPRFKDMYAATYQPIITELLQKNLQKGDVFIDVGANVGYFSAFALGIVGKSGQVHGFEPVPEYFEKLKKIADSNTGYKMTANGFALGDKEKVEKIYIGGRSCIGSNTFFPNLLEQEGGVASAEVAVRRLDNYIEEKKLENIKLIKIDVEGFELPVLKGLSGYFSKCKKTGFFPNIICEIIPSVYPQMGYKLADIFDYMAGFSYYPFEVSNTKKRVNIKKIANRHVTDVFFKVISNQ